MTSSSEKHQPLQSEPVIGSTFAGSYFIERRLGRGGMGVVYLARQVELDRQVVIKVLAPDWIGEPEALARFEREARGLSSLQHPNIVTIHDFGRVGGQAFIVMEYVQGETLEHFVRRKQRLPLATFVPIAAQVLKGLGEAHARGIIHRDIKPANIMLCERRGRANFVKILDFGLAKLVSGSADITKQNVLGTPTCLSPEQIQGKRADQRVDVYAVGILFYFMLTGELPFHGENDASVLYKHVHEQPAPLVSKLPQSHDVPAGVISLIEDCLQKDPEKRPADANVVVEQLIDQVPFSMFRLPRIGTHESAATSSTDIYESSQDLLLSATAVRQVTKNGQQGLKNSTTGEKSLLDISGMISADTMAELEAKGIAVDPSSVFQDQQGRTVVVVEGESSPENERKRGLLVASGVGLAVVLSTVMGVWWFNSEEDPPSSPSIAATEPVKETPVESLPAQKPTFEQVKEVLGRVDQMIDKQQFHQASVLLASRDEDFSVFPQLLPEVQTRKQRIEVEKLLVSAHAFEQENDPMAALRVYRRALQIAPTRAPQIHQSMEKLLAMPVPEGEVVFVLLRSTPSANVRIDGQLLTGNTPLMVALLPGDHALQLAAEGFADIDQKLTITANQDENLNFQLASIVEAKESDSTTSKKKRFLQKSSQTSSAQTSTEDSSLKKQDGSSDLLSGDKSTKKSQDDLLPVGGT